MRLRLLGLREEAALGVFLRERPVPGALHESVPDAANRAPEHLCTVASVVVPETQVPIQLQLDVLPELSRRTLAAFQSAIWLV